MVESFRGPSVRNFCRTYSLAAVGVRNAHTVIKKRSSLWTAMTKKRKIVLTLQKSHWTPRKSATETRIVTMTCLRSRRKMPRNMSINTPAACITTMIVNKRRTRSSKIRSLRTIG